MTKPLAIQLYTLRDPERFGGTGFGLDVAGLEELAAIGYLGVETVDVPGGDPVAARRALGDAGLAVTSAHTWASVEDLDGFARAAAAIAELEAPHIIVSGPGWADEAAVLAFADVINAAARVASEHGLRLGYHNHDPEVRSIDGVTGLRRLADATDPAVGFQVDVFWVVVGGADPAIVLGELDGRVISLHLKDGVTLPTSARDGGPFLNVPVGAGVVDVATAVAAAEVQPGIDWLIVEADHPDGPPMDLARASHATLVGRALGRGREA